MAVSLTARNAQIHIKHEAVRPDALAGSALEKKVSIPGDRRKKDALAVAFIPLH